MTIEVNGETYYTKSEAAKYLGISRPTFDQNVGRELPEYKYGALRRVYYCQSDLDRFKGIRQVDNGDDQEK